jgi:thiosulfate/3-mercaptopyruvate sulfurtransferase
MKTNKILKLALIVLFTVCGFYILAQNPVNWSDKQLMEPSTLATTLKAGKNIPTIISVGPGAIIPNSVDIGTMKETANLQKLKDQLSKLPKNTKIVVYCGCCPFEHCPNVRPAIAALKEMKFTNYFLLNIPKNIKTDWIDKGYPVNK